MFDVDTPGWRVKLPIFEGPLDLLLYLAKKNEVDIYEIEIGKITDQYLEYLDILQEMDLEVAGEFLVIAATLVYIKSRTLLPQDQQLPEEEAEEDDPRWELIRQLVEYKKFKEAAGDLGMREEQQSQIFYRDVVPEKVKPTDSGLGKVGVFDLVNAFQKILQRVQEKHGVREIFEDKFTVGEKIEFIMERIESCARMQFSTLFSGMTSRSEIVVTFLALLELIRLKKVKAEQSEAFEEIDILRADLESDVESSEGDEGDEEDERNEEQGS